MSKEAKKNYVEEMKKNFNENESVMIAQYQGLNVNELDALRKELREKGLYYSTKYDKNDIILLKQKGWKNFKKGKLDIRKTIRDN